MTPRKATLSKSPTFLILKSATESLRLKVFQLKFVVLVFILILTMVVFYFLGVMAPWR